MSTYSSDLRIELIPNGSQAGTWGTTTNDTLAYVIDPAISGFQTVAVSSANQALTYVSGSTATASANQSIYASLAFTTSTGANFAVYAPPNPKQYVLWNNSAYVLTIYNSTVIGNTTAAGTGVQVPAGKKLLVFSDGTSFYAVDAGSLTATVPVANGGTGVTTLTGVAYGNGTSPFTAATGAQIVSAIGATAVTNATNATNATNSTNATNVVSGGTIASNVTATTQSVGTNNTTVATTAFVLANAGGSSVNMQKYDAAGTYTFTVPSGVTKLKITAFGGGGGGWHRYDYYYGRGGDGGMGTALVTVTPGASYTVTIGSGGNGADIPGYSVTTYGTSGGTTSFGSLVTATGGTSSTSAVGAFSTTGTLIGDNKINGLGLYLGGGSPPNFSAGVSFRLVDAYLIPAGSGMHGGGSNINTPAAAANIPRSIFGQNGNMPSGVSGGSGGGTGGGAGGTGYNGCCGAFPGCGGGGAGGMIIEW